MAQALTEKTFSLEIIDKIKEIRDDLVRMQADFEDYKENHNRLEKSLRDETDRLRRREEELTKEVTELRAYKEGRVAKDRDQDKTLYELNFQRNRANEMKEILGVIFKNPGVRRTIHKQGNEPVACDSGQYVQSGYTDQTTTETEEEF